MGDCGQKFIHDHSFQNHIATCPMMKKGLRSSSQQLLSKSLGMSATSCKDDRIRWLGLKSEFKAMHLPPSDLDEKSIQKHQQARVNSVIKEQQQARVGRLEKMIECEKMRKESAQDKTSIANIESVIAAIEEQQENKENPPTLLFDDIPDDGYNHKKIEEEKGPDEPSDKYLRKVLGKNNLPTDGLR